MANIQQGRASKEALTAGSAFTPASAHGGLTVSAPAVVYVRLWTAPLAANQSLWKSSLASAGLALDVIASSGADPQTSDGSVVLAEYASVTAAVLAARRLQWAFEGLSEQEVEKHSGAAVLVCTNSEVCSGDDSGAIGEALSRALEAASRGQILVSREVAPALNGLPGFAMGAPNQDGWQELHWSNPSETSASAVDEEQLRRLLKQLGKDDPGPAIIAEPEPVAAPVPVQPASGSRPISGSRPVSLSRPISASRPISVSQPISSSRPITAPRSIPVSGQIPLVVEPPAEPQEAAEEIVAGEEHRSAEGEGIKRPLILGGIAAAVLVAIGVTVAGMHHQPAPQPSPATPPVTAVDSSTNGSEPAKKAHEAKPSPSVMSSKKAPKTESKSTPATLQATSKPAVADSCDLTEGEIPRSLQRAESDMHAGRLEAAKNAFTRLRGCPSARDRAEEDLRLTLERIDAQK